MEISKVILVCVVLFVSNGLTSAEPSRDKFKAEPNELINVGTADGKTYYVDHNLWLNYTAASDFCQQYDLSLASIHTEQQLYLIVNALSAHIGSYYWTSAREIVTPSMFAWDQDEEKLNLTLLNNWFMNWTKAYPPYKYCASLRINPNREYDMHPQRCNVQNFPLCMTK